MMPALLIRALSAKDLPQVSEWMQTAEAPRWSDADLLLAVENATPMPGRERRGWALEDGRGQLAGFLVAAALRLPDGPAECELEFVFVAPHWRRSGAGRALLQHLLQWVEQTNAGDVRLEVRASNMAARRLYAACGFAEAGVRPGYYLDPPEDAVLMRMRAGAPV